MAEDNECLEAPFESDVQRRPVDSKIVSERRGRNIDLAYPLLPRLEWDLEVDVRPRVSPFILCVVLYRPALSTEMTGLIAQTHELFKGPGDAHPGRMTRVVEAETGDMTLTVDLYKNPA